MGVLNDYHLAFLDAAQEELENYLLSPELFWSIKGWNVKDQRAFPQLTVGTILLSLLLNHATQKNVQDEHLLIGLERKVNVVKTKWQVAWTKKASWEFKSRLRQWGNYLNEIQENREEVAPYYGYEVRWRVVLELLKREIDGIEPENLELLLSLDAALQAHIKVRDFIWDDCLVPGFEKEDFWYLWGDLG